MKLLSALLCVLTLTSGSASAGVVITGGGLALVEEGGTFAPGNVATGKTAFAKDEIGVAPHNISVLISDPSALRRYPTRRTQVATAAASISRR